MTATSATYPDRIRPEGVLTHADCWEIVNFIIECGGSLNPVAGWELYDPELNRQTVSEALGVNRKTLQRWEQQGVGPAPYQRDCTCWTPSGRPEHLKGHRVYKAGEVSDWIMTEHGVKYALRWRKHLESMNGAPRYGESLPGFMERHNAPIPREDREQPCACGACRASAIEPEPDI